MLIDQININYEIQPIIDYFEDMYIGGKSSIIRNRYIFTLILFKILNLFYIGIWNCYASVVNKLPRTNNSVEGWHRGFSTMAGKHPTIFKFIEFLRLELSKNQITFNKLSLSRIFTSMISMIRHIHYATEALYANLQRSSNIFSR